jgi:hypothetical protein
LGGVRTNSLPFPFSVERGVSEKEGAGLVSKVSLLVKSLNWVVILEPLIPISPRQWLALFHLQVG